MTLNQKCGLRVSFFFLMWILIRKGSFQGSSENANIEQRYQTRGILWHPVVRIPHSHCRGPRVQSLAGELRTRKLHGEAKKKSV